MENQIAIHENENSEKVVKYIAESEFNDEIISMLNNGNIYGLFFEGDTIVAVDIWQTKHYDIFK